MAVEHGGKEEGRTSSPGAVSGYSRQREALLCSGSSSIITQQVYLCPWGTQFWGGGEKADMTQSLCTASLRLSLNLATPGPRPCTPLPFLLHLSHAAACSCRTPNLVQKSRACVGLRAGCKDLASPGRAPVNPAPCVISRGCMAGGWNLNEQLMLQTL